MKNILIMGIDKAGKTTLSKMLKDKAGGHSLIHSDVLKWAMIRVEGREAWFREHVDFQRTLLGFFNSSIAKGGRYILESSQLYPQIVKEMVDFKSTAVVCLGLGGILPEDMVQMCLEHDGPESWTYGLPKEYLLRHAKDWHSADKVLMDECLACGIPYYDTYRDRKMCLARIMDDILKMAGE